MNKINRREFLKTSSLAAMGITVAAGLSRTVVAGSPNWAMRLSTSSVMFDTLPIETACEQIARLKFEAIDIWCPFNACGAHCNHLEDVATRLGADGLKAVLTKHNLKISAFSCYGGHYPKYAELLGKIGGGVAIRESGSLKQGDELVPKMKDFFERLKPYTDLAAQYNSRIAIENHGGSLLGSIDSFKAFVDLNTNPHVGIALAPYHLQTIKASVEEAIAICGSQLCYFYAWQHAQGTEQLPGIGPTDFVPWLKALAKIKFAGCVNPFMHNHPKPDEMAAAVSKSREYLLQCYQKAVA